MLMALLAGLLVATVPLFGGRLRALAHLRIQSFWLIGAALALQVLAISVVPTWPRAVLVSAHLVSYLMAGWFVWLNRRVSGLPIVALGGALNAVTIAVNGGPCLRRGRRLRRPVSIRSRATSITPACSPTRTSRGSATSYRYLRVCRWPMCSASATC